MDAYTITPLVTMATETDYSLLVYGNNFGVKIDALAVCWLLRGPGGTILIDSGVDADAPIAGRPRYRKRLDLLLQDAEVDPAAVELIILTHLHWEQCGNFALFPNAEILVQERELAYATAPYPYHWRDYQALKTGMKPPWFAHRRRLRTMDGDYEPRPGVKVYLLPGHTPGMQNVAVPTVDGVTLVAGHNVPLAVNWEGNGKHKPIPSGIHVKLSEYYRSLQRMESLCDQVLPAQ